MVSELLRHLLLWLEGVQPSYPHLQQQPGLLEIWQEMRQHRAPLTEGFCREWGLLCVQKETENGDQISRSFLAQALSDRSAIASRYVSRYHPWWLAELASIMCIADAVLGRVRCGERLVSSHLFTRKRKSQDSRSLSGKQARTTDWLHSVITVLKYLSTFAGMYHPCTCLPTSTVNGIHTSYCRVWYALISTYLGR